MLLDFKSLVKKYNLQISGIIQLGASSGQEIPVFDSLGITDLVLVEPLTEPYNLLMQNISGHKNVSAFKVAISNETGIKIFFTNTNNEFQSSSLLKPKKHLEIYPDITFEQKEEVFCTTLDLLPFDKSKFSSLFMDLQGAELLALKGATETLKHINIIYTEVNKIELYEGCVLIDDLDNYLAGHGFERVETGEWIEDSWTDALYLRKILASGEKIFDPESEYLKNNPDVANAVINQNFTSGKDHYERFGKKEGRIWPEYVPNKIIGFKMKSSELHPATNFDYIDVPEEFRPVQNIIYPEGNNTPFERYFYEYYMKSKPNTVRTYLPIFWTAYYVNNKYGSDQKAIDKLQKYIDKLDKSKQYFSLVQYDDGILNDISGLDIIVFASGNNTSGYYPIPLLTETLKVEKIDYSIKNIFMSFTGADTHPIRQKLVKELGKHAPISLELVSREKYIDQLKHSIFALCPRGYGVTSFRLYEAMQYGAIPIYISDDGNFLEPFNLPFEYGIEINGEDIELIPDILAKVEPEPMRKKVAEYFERYFTFEACCHAIIQTLC